MKLLIAGFGLRYIHLKGFAKTLEKHNIECKVVVDSDIIDGFPSRKIKNWFQTKKKFKKLHIQHSPYAPPAHIKKQDLRMIQKLKDAGNIMIYSKHQAHQTIIQVMVVVQVMSYM